MIAVIYKNEDKVHISRINLDDEKYFAVYIHKSHDYKVITYYYSTIAIFDTNVTYTIIDLIKYELSDKYHTLYLQKINLDIIIALLKGRYEFICLEAYTTMFKKIVNKYKDKIVKSINIRFYIEKLFTYMENHDCEKCKLKINPLRTI